MNRGDVRGNGQYLGPDPYFDDMFCRAAKRRFMSVEKIVETGDMAKEGPLQTRVINRTMVALGMVALLVASCVLTYSVVSRYLMKASTDWQDEAAVFCLVGATFLCGAFVQQLRGHVGIEAVAGLLPRALNQLRLTLVDLLCTAFCSFFAWKSWTLFHEAWAEGQTTSSSWAPPLWIPYGLMAAGMTPPLGLALATLVAKNRFTAEEREAGGAAAVLGLSFITEGAIPFAAKDPARVIPSIIVGSAITGALSMALGCQLVAPHGGIFVFFAVGGIGWFLVSLAAGTVVAALAVVGAKGGVGASTIAHNHVIGLSCHTILRFATESFNFFLGFVSRHGK